MNRNGLIVAAVIAIVLVVVVIASATSANKHAKRPRAADTDKPALVANRSPVKLPDFAFPGDRHCAITYRAHGNGAMTWTAKVTVGGQIITHASDKSGHIYRRVTHVNPGPNVFTAPVPLSRINDIGGVLYTASTSYGCSIAPYRPGPGARPPARPARHKPAHHVAHRSKPRPQPTTPSPAPVAPPSTATSCYPLSNEGTCYEPGEFCRDSDHGATGLAGDGERIVCEDNDGWRWEPA